jgi:hypothetical protein
MFAYDPSLLEAVETTPRSVEDVVVILEAIEAACSDGDGLKWFNWLYLRVTQAVQARVNAAGFDDCAWIAALDVNFASFYFAAIRSSLSGTATPGCWKALFDRRDQPSIARIQFAFSGMNAHINHDLPQAIVSVCHAMSAAPQHGSTQYNDYTSLNATLDSLIDTAKKTLNVRLLGDALPPVSHLEDTLAAWSIAAARETAWNNAEVLCQLEAVPPLSSAFLDSLDGFTALAGKTLLVPVP